MNEGRSDGRHSNHPLQVFARKVREVLIARALKATAIKHQPLSQQQADAQIDGHVRDFKIDGGRLDLPMVGSFYATLLEDDLLLDMFEAKVVAEFALAEIFPYEQMKEGVEAKVEGVFLAEEADDFLRKHQ